jgi:hypothetical protein
MDHTPAAIAPVAGACEHAAYNRPMSAAARKKPVAASRPQVARPQPQAQRGKPARASQLRAQTRRLLGKHYRAKYGVR